MCFAPISVIIFLRFSRIVELLCVYARIFSLRWIVGLCTQPSERTLRNAPPTPTVPSSHAPHVQPTCSPFWTSLHLASPTSACTPLPRQRKVVPRDITHRASYSEHHACHCREIGRVMLGRVMLGWAGIATKLRAFSP